MNEIEHGHEYLLACTNEEYFSAIKSSEVYLSKLNRLRDHLPEAKTIASLGMAGGEDICTLAGIYGEETRLIGIDISPVAIELARKATLAAGVKADFIEGNATRLDIPDQSINGFVLSAILHEVYSYANEGKDAFANTIKETYRKTCGGGCILISDFAAPRIDNPVSLQPKSEDAKQFIDYFMKDFRAFNDTEVRTQKSLIAIDRSYSSYGTGVTVPEWVSPASASEVLWHFKHYKKYFDGNNSFDNKQRWKEINEVYLPPNPLVAEDQAMPIENYIDTIIRISQSAEISEDFALKCVSAVLTPQRQNTIDMLDQHFSVVLNDDKVTSKSIITECTNWMDLIFRKVRQ